MFLKILQKFTGKHLCQGSFFNKVVGLRPATLLKKRLWHRCFLVNFVKFLNTPFFIVHLWWLLLKAIATLFSIGKASRNRVSYFSSLFLDKAKASIIVSGVIWCAKYVETTVFFGKRSKRFFQLSDQWSIMQYLNFVSEKIFFSAVSIYGLLFLRGFWRLLINCLNNKRSNFSFITAHYFTSTVFIFFTLTYCTDTSRLWKYFYLL